MTRIQLSGRALRCSLLAACAFTAGLGVSSAFAAATIVIVPNDAAGVGFNDTTPAVPVGGNTGTTVGQQRMAAFQAAASIWGAALNSSVTITIRSQWQPLSCTKNTAVLGTAGATSIYRDFAGAPFVGTWYNEALVGSITGTDPNPNPEITATFNTDLGSANCLPGTPFYLGLDNNHGSAIDLVTALIHEFSHGLGFQTYTNSASGAPNNGAFSVYDHFLMDLTSGKSWLQMTNAERAASAVNKHKLAWNGLQVSADVPSALAVGVPLLDITAPASIAGSYDVGTAAFGPSLIAGGISGSLLLANDSGGESPTDGCEAFPAAFFSGKIAVIDRGNCSFKIQTLNAQNANALAVVIVDNVTGIQALVLKDDTTIVAPITIPAISVTQATGILIKAQLPTGVTGTARLDTSVRAGADRFGKALLFSPNPLQSGSSVSHWDPIAFPDQLMEPPIVGDLTHSVTAPADLTYSQLRDIGWVASVLPISIAIAGGNNQSASLSQAFATPIKVTVLPAVSGITVTWTVNPAGNGAGAMFPETGSRFAVSTTDATGAATAPTLIAVGAIGAHSMNATVPGAGTTTFTLTNTDSIFVDDFDG